jgi:hypothetical protein
MQETDLSGEHVVKFGVIDVSKIKNKSAFAVERAAYVTFEEGDYTKLLPNPRIQAAR